ncbi:MAG: hypothetical protein A4E54_02849 [Pelotomaculum sp. PtaB.Bin117]|nr:MAG: hypothetical protein A4E54_02849 [Pelotomaculum sp. PtaB.Bin117]OPY59117.1 MAG: hypothetical protein A4E56_03302 [Pelotomaculum sp. PtaU1.Bin065]
MSVRIYRYTTCSKIIHGRHTPLNTVRKFTYNDDYIYLVMDLEDVFKNISVKFSFINDNQ